MFFGDAYKTMQVEIRCVKTNNYLIYILYLSLACMLNNIAIHAQLKDLDVGEYETFFNSGLKKVEKPNSGSDKLQNSIHKSKVEVLGETLKKRVAMLRKAPSRQLELVFLVDSSASVGAENFFNELKFVRKLLADFTVSYNYTRVAVVTFSSRSRVVRQIDHLSNSSTKNHKCRLLAEELPKINYTGGGTYTLGAILEAQSILKRARPNAVKVVFLITDGYSNGGDPRVAAKILRDTNVEMFTFGIKNGNVRELYDMASPPPQEHSYILDSFEEFEALARRALHEDLHIGSYEEEDANMCKQLCEERENCCDIKAKCACGTHTGHYACLCQKGFYGTGLQGDCKPCPAGTYLDVSGPADIGACKLCPDINHYSEPGSSSVDDCQCRKGYMRNNTKCVEMECQKLMPPENGYFVKNGCGHVFNSACGIRCNPGYTLFGSSIRLCNEDGEWTGEEPTCVIKNCTKLKEPRHGKMECNNDAFAFETHCNFSCDPGFVAIGSKMRTCLAIASWDGLPSHCRPVTCPALSPIPNGSVTPSKCTTHKSQFGDTCDYSCESGYTLLGPAKRTCIKQGGWSSPEKKTRCIDSTPPNITCPSDVEVKAEENENSATISWDPPTTSDNSKEKVIVTSIPAVSLPLKFPIGTSIVTYVAQDRLKNRAECNFTVNVLDIQPPTIDSCISPPIFLTREKSVQVIWDEPIFSDNSGQAVQVNRSHEPGPFPFGETQVTYVAWDDSGNNSTCTIIITVQEHACATPMDPINGHSNCSEFDDGVVCSLTCEDGYAFAFRPPTSYFCAFDGEWVPKKESFPDCSLTVLPRDALQNGVITLQSEDVPCDDTFFLHQVENKFQRKLSNKVMQYCVDEIECDAPHVSAACEELISEAEEESNYILKRRRRQLEVLTQFNQSSTEPVNSTESSVSLRYVANKNTDEREMQKVSLRFQLTGKSKSDAQNTTQNTTVLKAAMYNALKNLKRDAEKGELDLLMGQRYLTYSGMRLTTEQPLFQCEPGSILQEEHCVRCPVGTFYNVVSETCQPCDRGSYQFAEGQLSCLVCPDNTSTSHGQSKSSGECKAQCLPGSFSSNGLEHCETCAKSFYQQDYAQTSCLPCPTNTTTWKRGARKVLECRELCPKGQVSETGLVPCYTCPLGYYQPEKGKRVCFRCHNGSPTAEMGSTSEKDCLETPLSDEAGTDAPVEELLVNDCFSVPCLNSGSCRVLTFGYICDCVPGFSGTHCETEVNECDSSPCQNGGKCEDQKNGYKCHCAPGYGGVNCEDDLNECALSPCLNGGTCIDQINDFQCQCTSGFAGRICQNDINECILRPCQNEGTCIDEIASYHCICPRGFIGIDCETDVDECESLPCTNGATCLDLKGEFKCQCPHGFTGVYCEVNINECAPDPCTNGATCIDQINAFKCVCPPAYAGKRCETELSSDFIMHFPISGIMDYTQSEGFHRDLAQMSACLWVKTNDSQNYGTPISYANASIDNIFTLTDYNGFVFYVNGEKVITDVTANDNRWHFVCVTWNNAGGLWKIYDNGILKDEGNALANGTLLPGDGTLVIGQEQDTLLGGFSAAESFIGYIGFVDFWDRVLAPQEILHFSTTCMKYRGSVRAWADFLAGIKGRVKLEESMFCKGCHLVGSIENGRVIQSGIGIESFLNYECVEGYTIKGSSKRKCMIHGDWEGKEPNCQLSSCGFPGYLENGRIVGNGYMYRDVIRYICSAGYQLVGNETRVCKVSGQWEAEPPVCTEILCDPPLPPQNGELTTNLTRFRSSVQVDYTCNPGYRLNGASSLTCTFDGIWDEEPPSCQPMLCSDPPVLKNGHIVDGVREVQVGENLTLECDEGYRLLGGRELLCSDKRQWEGDLPHCSPVDCGRPQRIPNSKYEVADTIFKSDVNYTCLDGYEMNGTVTVMLTCGTLGKWEGPEIQCNPVPCPTPQSVRYGDIKVGAVVYKSTVTYSCMEGYELTGDSVRICLANGTWSGHSPTCSRVRCSAPDPVPNGQIVGKGPWVAGTTVTFVCSTGYWLEGPSQQTCLETGKWSQQTPHCRVIECPNPEPVANGFSIGDTFTYLSIILYACEAGHRLDGDYSRQCTANGSWSGASPKCAKVSCGSVDNIKHGKVILDSFLYLSLVQYVCNKGFQLQGPQVRTCQANGTWSGYEPVCLRAQCPSPGFIPNGEVKESGTVHGAIAEYFCHDGHILEGQTQRKCEDKGVLQWSGSAPVCRPVNCTALDQIPYGYVQAFSLQYESVAEYGCIPGYDLIGTTLRVCQKDGSWSDSAPTCRIQECSKPKDISHGRSIGGSYAVGAIIQFECEPGYFLVGSENVTCTENKFWNTLVPHCVPITCAWPLQVPPNGLINSTGHSFNSEVNYLCNEGFELVGTSKRVCLADGTWSADEPQCKPVQCPQLEQLKNGIMEVNETLLGNVVRYTCNKDYILQGAPIRRCLANKTWSASAPFCEPLMCPKLESISEGWLMLSDQSLTLGTVANYTCDMGYRLIGNETLNCKNPGYWDGSIPECRPILCPPLNSSRIPHGRILQSHGENDAMSRQFGSTLQFICDTGYKLVGESVIRCLPTGRWNAPFPICAITSCPPPQSISQGKMSAEEFTVGAKVIYSCDPGFKLDGDANRTCTSKNSWSGVLPRCQVIRCPNPKQIANGKSVTVEGSEMHLYSYRTNISFECNTGFILRGEAIILCNEDGFWSSDEPSCEVIKCQQPNEIDNGQAEVILPENQNTESGKLNWGKLYPWKTQAKYTCNPGYILEGNVNPRQCNDGGQWSGNTPECRPVSCGQPTKLMNGQIQVNSVFFESIAKYSCDNGYFLNGSTQRTCLTNGSWSGTQPKCTIVRCPHVGLLRHGKYRLQGNGAYGTVVMAECDAEFRLIGNGVRTCQNDGNWSGSEPHCASIECPIPEMIPHGKMELDSTVVGGALQYGCERGYELVGESILTCMLDGSWSREAPTCSAIECPQLTALPYGQVISDGQQFGSIAEYHCNDGYELQGGDDKRTCFENRTWSGTKPTCTPILCAHPTDIQHGKISVYGLGLGSVITYTCDKGYYISGTGTRTCQKNHKWSGHNPVCRIVNCPSPEPIQNGRILSISGGELSNYGTIVKFTCAPLYTLHGKDKLQCLGNGTWDAPPPSCIRSYCEKPVAIPDSVIQGNLTGIGHNISYACREGFILFGERSRQCMHGGNWSGDIPKCVPISCGAPPEVDNALIQLVIPHGQEEYSYSSTAAYACTDGYELIGSPALVCEADGKWFGRTPSCKRLTCGPPPVVVHATVQVENYEQLSRAVYFCNEGYKLVGNGSTVAHCLPSGNWDSDAEGVKCTAVICGQPPNILDGQVTVANKNYGSVAIYTCNLGFRKTPTYGRRITCNSQGKWQGSMPQCRPITCPPPELPANSMLEIGGEFRFGMTVNYTCRMGFRLVGEGIRICQINGQWSGGIPQCHRIQCKEPESPHNGFAMVDDRKLGDTARFRCEEGYELEGAEIITCDESGNWTMATPICRPIKCDNPSLPPNATIISEKETYVFGDIVRPTCAQGYYPTSEIMIECLADGNWSVSTGQCQRVSCGPPHINSGVVVLGSSYFYQDKLAYVCPPGLQHKGKGVLTCQIDGTWDSAPACEVLCAKPCLNGGICIRAGKCKCPAGFVGDRCQYPICILPCLHGGTCVGPYLCICNPGYTGSRCQISLCSIPCLHGGTCIGHNVCSCLPGYSGFQCETSIDKET